MPVGDGSANFGFRTLVLFSSVNKITTAVFSKTSFVSEVGSGRPSREKTVGLLPEGVGGALWSRVATRARSWETAGSWRLRFPTLYFLT